MRLINVKDIQEGDILGKDLYRGNSLILKKGSSLTKTIISKLKQWDFSTVAISDDQEEDESDDNNINNGIQSEQSPPAISELKSSFFENIANIGHEYRYGNALHESNDYHWLENLFISFMSNPSIYNLLKKLKEWDFYSYQHSFDVFILGTLFAKKIEADDIEEFSLGCLLHDIGKLDIPTSILKKPSKLSSEEYDLIKSHTIYGYKILKQNNFSEKISIMAKHHHERIDGSGYPEGLKYNEINERAKILGMVDVYSALTLNRPYRSAFSSPAAEKILIDECRMADNLYYYKFFKMLDIFPLNATVKLTNGTEAKIIYINDRVPSYPLLKDTHNKSVQIKMPLNKSVRINNILKL